MEIMVIVTVIVLLQFVVYSFQVGQMRGKHGVKAPAITGHQEFERAFRVQQNTMEQLVVAIPAMWLFGTYFNPLYAAALGGVFVVGRVIYRAAYMKDPSSRSTGFTIGFMAVVVMLIGALVGAGMAYF